MLPYSAFDSLSVSLIGSKRKPSGPVPPAIMSGPRVVNASTPRGDSWRDSRRSHAANGCRGRCENRDPTQMRSYSAGIATRAGSVCEANARTWKVRATNRTASAAMSLASTASAPNSRTR